jgi:hypothetical protein
MRLKLLGALITLAALLLGVGVAYGLPHSNALASRTAKKEKHEAGPSEGTEQSRREDASNPHGGHGAVVSAAARCILKGAAHGALVRSVATDKRATPAASISACKEAGGTQRTGPGNSAWAHNKAHGKANESHGKSQGAR